MKMIVFGMSTGSAQQTIKGTVTGIDEPNGTISIQRTVSGTVGTNGAAATDSYKVKDGAVQCRAAWRKSSGFGRNQRQR